MRICIVGCGAVGSLFAANLAQLDDVEVWAFDAANVEDGPVAVWQADYAWPLGFHGTWAKA